MDATRVVLHGQAHARIDLVCDGELYRFTLTGPHMLAKMLHDRYYLIPRSSRTPSATCWRNKWPTSMPT